MTGIAALRTLNAQIRALIDSYAETPPTSAELFELKAMLRDAARMEEEVRSGLAQCETDVQRLRLEAEFFAQWSSRPLSADNRDRFRTANECFERLHQRNRA